MGITGKEIQDLVSSGITPHELLQGVEVEEPGILGLTKKVMAKSPGEKRNVLHEETRILIRENRGKNTPLKGRNILQEIGGGALKEREWIQVSPSPNHAELIITGTRGVFRLKS
jgi:hypothetical protein